MVEFFVGKFIFKFFFVLRFKIFRILDLRFRISILLFLGRLVFFFRLFLKDGRFGILLLRKSSYLNK